MRYELTDHEWAAIKPMLPNKPRGIPRVNDRRVPATRGALDSPTR
jgi:transposase